MEKLVFFVDDDKSMLNLLEYTISSRCTFGIKSFYRAEDCLENLGMNPDLVVLDYLFKPVDGNKMSGMDALLEIRKKYKDLPVIILTGVGGDTLAEEFMKKGATEFIRKDNYFIDTLLERISRYLS
jgi:DNA-binding NtrC family response regulator